MATPTDPRRRPRPAADLTTAGSTTVAPTPITIMTKPCMTPTQSTPSSPTTTKTACSSPDRQSCYSAHMDIITTILKTIYVPEWTSKDLYREYEGRCDHQGLQPTKFHFGKALTAVEAVRGEVEFAEETDESQPVSSGDEEEVYIDGLEEEEDDNSVLGTGSRDSPFDIAQQESQQDIEEIEDFLLHGLDKADDEQEGEDCGLTSPAYSPAGPDYSPASPAYASGPRDDDLPQHLSSQKRAYSSSAMTPHKGETSLSSPDVPAPKKAKTQTGSQETQSSRSLEYAIFGSDDEDDEDDDDDDNEVSKAMAEADNDGMTVEDEEEEEVEEEEEDEEEEEYEEEVEVEEEEEEEEEEEDEVAVLGSRSGPTPTEEEEEEN